MNKDSSLLLLHWIKSAGSLLIPSFLGPPPVNPVHPPSSTAPSSETPDPLTSLAFQSSPSPVTWVHNLLVFPPPSGGSLLHPIASRFQSPAFLSIIVNKILAVKLCLLIAFCMWVKAVKQYDILKNI
ncbi:hypothetical protein CHARACLAT_024996 [Characodon lateralis]|uniref:Uncharacterized protein n=1 Tax=Characodon lateralis TaxID=208331 RepID=A0ABU7EN81_9TELE|nr:hypothetical protein [Characodon lateralis]